MSLRPKVSVDRLHALDGLTEAPPPTVLGVHAFARLASQPSDAAPLLPRACAGA